MGDAELRDATVRFVADLCERAGPFTFAGFGGPIAALRHRAQQAAGDDVVAGIFAAEEQAVEVVRAWADEAPMPAMLEVLLDLFAAPPAEAGADPTEWRDQVTELLVVCGRRDREALVTALAARGEQLASLAADLRERFAEEP